METWGTYPLLGLVMFLEEIEAEKLSDAQGLTQPVSARTRTLGPWLPTYAFQHRPSSHGQFRFIFKIWPLETFPGTGPRGLKWFNAHFWERRATRPLSGFDQVCQYLHHRVICINFINNVKFLQSELTVSYSGLLKNPCYAIIPTKLTTRWSTEGNHWLQWLLLTILSVTIFKILYASLSCALKMRNLL